MKKIGTVLLILTLTACGRTAPTDTVESLAANPERLKEIQRLCKEDPAKMGVACNTASEAFRRRFAGDGKGQYTPAPAAQN